MIESHLTNQDLLNREITLGDSLRDDETDLTYIIDTRFSIMVSDIVDRGNEVRRLCKRLELQASATKTAAFTGAVTSQDYAQRNRCVIAITAISGEASFTLQGTDDETTYYDIETVVSSAEEEVTFKFNSYYKKYRLKLDSLGSTVTYSGYLVETGYEELHALGSLMDAYNRLRFRQSDDEFKEKYLEYREKYLTKLDTMRFFYDKDDSGSISESENYTQFNVRFSR